MMTLANVVMITMAVTISPRSLSQSCRLSNVVGGTRDGYSSIAILRAFVNRASAPLFQLRAVHRQDAARHLRPHRGQACRTSHCQSPPIMQRREITGAERRYRLSRLYRAPIIPQRRDFHQTLNAKSCKPQNLGTEIPCECPQATCAVTRRRFSSGCKAHPATAPAGSTRSRHGGDEMSEAFG